MDWIDKTTSGKAPYRANSVLVSLRDYGKKRQVAFSFSADVRRKLGKTGCIKFAVENNRMYFAETDARGYKMSSAGIAVTLNDNTAVLAEWAGRHPLRYDEKQELYYINKEE